MIDDKFADVNKLCHYKIITLVKMGNSKKCQQ